MSTKLAAFDYGKAMGTYFAIGRTGRVLGATAAALSLGGCMSGGGPAKQGGIVSTNPCADAVLVELAPERLSAISRYSHDPAATSLPLDIARRFPATAGTAEEVIALRPVLVVSSSLTPLATRTAYARAGLRVMLFGAPGSIAESEAQVRELATAVGEPARGAAIVARIERAVAAARPAGRDGPSTLLFLFGGIATGPGNLLEDLMTHAGLHNAARDYGLSHTGPVALESIAARPPALILTTGPSRGAGLRARVLARLGARTRNATFARDLINCGGPTIIPAVARLAALRRSVS